MTWEIAIELFGYLGSALVVIAMLMSSVVKLRVINTLGSIISGIYALIIGSFPLALMNVSLVVINLYNLRKLLITKQQYHLVKCNSQDGSVEFFLEQYQQDIRLYFAQPKPANADVAYLIFCNNAPAGILLGRNMAAGQIEVLLEYTTPAYRDCSIGKFLYGALPAQGIHSLQVSSCLESHRSYLEKMGFSCTEGQYRKIL